MSYILDAIRKAEQERQNKREPDVHSIHSSNMQMAAARGTSWLPIVVTVVLLLVTANVAYWWWQSRSENSNAEGVAVVTENPPTPDTPRTAPEAEPQRALLELWQAPANVKAAVSGLEFSFHVFSDSPTKRTIIINNRRKREGEKLTGDLLLQEITREGVILRHPDADVNVPVIEGW